MLIRYDRFLRTRVFNPFFRGVQMVFNVNRWHLLIAVELMRIALYAITFLAMATIALTLHRFYQMVYVSIGLASLLLLLWSKIVVPQNVRLRAAMTLMAQRDEEGRRFEPSEELLTHGRDLRRDRPFWNVVNSAFWTYFLSSMAVFGRGDPVFLVMSLGMICYSTIDTVAAHLWDIDDIDPLERESLFGRAPQPQRQKV